MNSSSVRSSGFCFGGIHLYNLWNKSPSSSGNPLISRQASKSSRSRRELSRFVNAIGTNCEIVYPITKIFNVFSIFAKTSLGANSPSICKTADSSSNNSKTWMYMFTDEIKAIAKNGKIIFLANLATCGFVWLNFCVLIQNENFL